MAINHSPGFTLSLRFWELDVVRGIAFILMAVYHTLFFLNFMQIAALPLESIPIFLIGRTAALLFILLVGCSAYLRYTKLSKIMPSSRVTVEFLKRGVGIFSAGLFVTLASALILPEFCIIFGILHFIGVSTVLARLLVTFSTRGLVLFTFFSWIIGNWFDHLVIGTQVGLIFGIKPVGFTTLDYYPLFPWLGFICIGIMLSKQLYAGGQRSGILQRLPQQMPPYLAVFNWAGTHALLLYLIHMPIIMAVFLILRIWQ